jgi:hypothetical protein
MSLLPTACPLIEMPKAKKKPNHVAGSALI